MLAAAMMADVGPPSAVYVGESHLVGASDYGEGLAGPYRVYPDLAGAGAQIGDYVLIFVQINSGEPYPSAMYGGWSNDNYTWTPGPTLRTSVFHKRITSVADFSFGVTLNQTYATAANTMTLVLVYRGATSAARVSLNWDGDGGSTHTSAGFAKSYGCVGVVAWLAHWDNNTATPAEAITGGTIVQRVNWSPYFRVVSADALGRYDYPSWATVDWSGLSTTLARPLVSMLYELRA